MPLLERLIIFFLRDSKTMNNNPAFKASSYNPNVDFVIIEKDQLGWKLDAHGKYGRSIPDGDTYQDNLDQLMPFLKTFVDNTSVWKNYDTGEVVTFWDVLSTYFDGLD